MKICSFLPSATEMVCLLGLEDGLVGVTHECDYPLSVRSLPRVVTSRFDHRKMAPDEIDRRVAEALRKGESLYQVHEEMLLDLKPDLIVTQDLCQVCAPSGNEASQVLKKLPKGTQVLYFSPSTIEGIFGNILELGRASGTDETARKRVAEFRETLDGIRSKASRAAPAAVFLMEWLDPPYCAGHWLPEMAEIAGGLDPFGRKGADSVRVPWEKVRESDPGTIVATPCGYHLADAADSAERLLPKYPGMKDLKAYREGRIYAVDADAYLVRPGPRVVEGVKILAEILHPELFKGVAPEGTYRRILKA